MNNYKNYSFSNRKIIERIVTVKEWNLTAGKEDTVKMKYGFVMPIYGGFEWRKTKQELINKYTY